MVTVSAELKPICWATVNAKKAFNPIPGASATGILAYIPMINVATHDEITVYKNKPPWYWLAKVVSGAFQGSIGLNPIIDGFIAMI